MKINFTKAIPIKFDELVSGRVYTVDLSNMALMFVVGTNKKGLVDLFDGSFYEAVEKGWVLDANYWPAEAYATVSRTN